MATELRHIIHDAQTCSALINGKYVPARPLTWSRLNFWRRLKDAWLVLTDKADAVIWPEGQ